MKTKEELKEEIAKLDGLLYKFDLNHSNLLEFRKLVNERTKLETELKAVSNYIPSINISLSPIAGGQQN